MELPILAIHCPDLNPTTQKPRMLNRASRALLGKAMSQALNMDHCAVVKSGIELNAEVSVKSFAEGLKLPAATLLEYGLRIVDGAIEVPYRRKGGDHVRYRYLHDTSGQGSWDDDEQAGRCLYGLDTLPAWGNTVFLVVGETACHVIWHCGLDAVGLADLCDFDPKRDDEELAPYDIIALLKRGAEGEAMVEALSRSRIRHRMHVTYLVDYADIVQAQVAGANMSILLQQAKADSQLLDKYLEKHPLLDRQKIPERTEIQLKVGERTRVIDEVIEVIRRHGALYERGGELVRLCDNIVVPVQEHWLADYLGRLIAWKRWLPDGSGGFKLAVTDTPSWICKVFLQKRGERGLNELTGIITAPTIRDDGTLLERPGFDEATGLLLRPGQWPRIPENPSMDDLREAWKLLWQPVAEFPFVSNVDRAVAVAAMLTATVRRTLPKAPAFSFDAPVAGSGKTLLATCIAELAGGDVAAMPECREEDEFRKRLLSLLREGQPAFLLDNVKGQFKSSALEAFLTEEYFSDRVLAASQTLRLRTNILMLISGNNFIPQGDLWRRVITCRIDPRVENAERRSFAFDPRQHCRTHRQELVAAALTLMRGHVAASSPRFTPDRLASFEAWDDRIRQCVLWLTNIGITELADPTSPIAAAKEIEPERLKLGAFLESVAAVMGCGDGAERWRTNDLIQRANTALDFEPHQELRDVLVEIAGERGTICPRRLGRWIEKQTDSRCGGLFVERMGEKKRAALWRISGKQSSPNSGERSVL